MFPPSRIVCLTEDTVETLYLLGQQDRVVGISGYVVRPPEARREKPRVSAFASANIEKILALRPDLVLTFSDLQADIAADLIRRRLDVHAFNQRSVAGVLDMMRTLGAMLDVSEQARQLVATLETNLAEARSRADRLPNRPKVFFEEWDEPLISGIGWVSELVEIAGGIDISADRRHQGAAKNRIVTAEEVVAREPELSRKQFERGDCGKGSRRRSTSMDRVRRTADRCTDNFMPLSSLDWQVHVYGEPRGIPELCRRRGSPSHVFPWQPMMSRAGLARNAVYLVRPDGYVALADPDASASRLEAYLDARSVRPKSPSRVLVQERQFDPSGAHGASL